jgi:hypothetical protein
LWGIFPVNEGKVYKSINKYIYIFGRKKHITQLIKLVGAVVFHPRNV